MGYENQEKTIALPEKSEMNLSESALFMCVMRNKEAYENTLSIIMDEFGLKLTEVHTEEVIPNEKGKRAIRLDAWAVDKQKRQYDIEMQNDTSGDDIRKRARFYQGLLDAPILKSGKDTRYHQLPATFIIFITQEDIFKQDLTMYVFTEQCENIQGFHLGDETTKIFLNMASKNGRAELVSLLQYMKDSRLDNPEILVKDPRIERLAEIVERVKQSEEWEDERMSIYSAGVDRGKTEAVMVILDKLGLLSEELKSKIQSQNGVEAVNAWLNKAEAVDSIEDFVKELEKV